MKFNQPQAPYYDDYDPSKGYIQHLAVPERVEQAREFNQIQSISLDYISRVGSAVFKEGAIIEGCTLTISGTTVAITSGKIFLGGLVRIVDGAVLTIQGLGTEHIGAKLTTDIVDEDIDPSLVDPAVGYINYNQPGAHRLRQRVEFFIDEDGTTTIYTLKDGALLNESENAEDTVITDTLARRTYDESGNFKVSGLDIMEREGSNDLAISITNGKAYIRGYEVTKPTISTMQLRATNDVETINSEPKLFTLASELYKLNYGPIAAINRIVAQVRITEERMTRLAPAGGIDALAHSPVVSIDSVWTTNAGAESTLYQQNRDFTLAADSIDWSLNLPDSQEPAVGSTYFVTYTYNKQLVEGEDYKLVEKDGDNYIQFLSSGNLPVVGSRANVTYQAYLARRDLLLLDKDGEYSIIEGKSDRYDRLITPYNKDESKLALGHIDILPNSSGLVYVNYKTVRLTQPEIYALSRRIGDLEYNQAMQDLDNEAEAGESATELKGIYTDGFIGFSKCDLTHPEFNCCIDYENGEMTLPVTSIEANGVQIGDESVIGTIGRVISAPYEHRLVLKQPNASGSMLVNPYAAYNPMSIVKLDPAVDNWVETDTVKVYDTDTQTRYTTSYSTVNRSASRSFRSSNARRTYTETSQSTSANTTRSNSTSTNITETINDTMLEYMRVREIKVTGSAFESGQDNITCYFNDVEVALTPTGNSQAGTNPGTVRADELGNFTARFTIPENTPCGTVLVRLEGSVSSGTTQYTAEGVLRTKTIRETEILTTTVHTNYVTTITTTTVHDLDPLAQSFKFTSDTVLTKVGLYFAAKDATRPVVVQIRNMVNGYPGTDCYAEVTVPSSAINASSDASAVTEVEFNQPVYCNANEFYCVVIISDSNTYELWYGELATNDILTGEYISTQPYLVGVMFSSSNGSTWTAHQTCDLKFDLYAAHYTGKGSIIFENVSATNFNRLLLAAEYIDYKNAGINWYYRYMTEAGSWSSWLNLDTYLERPTEEISSQLQLKAELNVAYQTSPMLALDCINLITFTDGVEATYVSKTIFLSEAYTKLKIACQMYLPSNYTACGYRLYYSTDSGDNWIPVDQTPVTSQVNEEFYEYLWELDTVNGGSADSYKVKLELWTNNVFYRPRARKLRSILKY